MSLLYEGFHYITYSVQFTAESEFMCGNNSKQKNMGDLLVE